MSMKPIAAACSSIVVLAGALGPVAETHAARYTGTFDPRGTVYGFEGTHEFDVDDACLTNTGWQAVNADRYLTDGYTYNTYNSCGAAALIGGSVTLTKYSGSLVAAQQTFNFSDELALPDSYDIWGIYVAYDTNTGRNELVGVDSFLVGPFDFDSQSWWLKWVSDQAPGLPYVGFDPVVLYTASCPDVGESCDDLALAAVPPAIPTFNRVPEPGALALALLALAAMAGVSGAARRRSAAHPPR